MNDVVYKTRKGQVDGVRSAIDVFVCFVLSMEENVGRGMYSRTYSILFVGLELAPFYY